MAVSLGCTYLGGAYPKPNLDHVPSQIRGVSKRVARAVPDGVPSVKKRVKHFVKHWLSKNLATPLGPGDIPSFDAWLEAVDAPAWRKNELKDAKDKVDNMLRPLKDRRVIELQCFTKEERYPLYKEFRGIYSRSDYFKVLAGPIFKAIEKIVYSIKTNNSGSVSLTDNVMHTEVFVKHIPVLKRAEHVLKKLRGVGRKYIATDYTAFESHFTAEIMEMIEFQLYRHLFRALPLESIFLEAILEVLKGSNLCKFRRFWCTLKAGRMSGEMNTSLGNGFANLMIFLFINSELGNTDIDCVVEGDDLAGCFAGINPEEKHYETVGFTCKVENIPELCEASFCGLIYDEQEMLSICDPIKVLLNVGWSSKTYVDCSKKKRLRLLKAKLLSIVHQYPGVPILQPFARRMLSLLHPRLKADFRALDKYVYNDIKLLVHGDLPPEQPITPRTRFLMSRVFGISIGEQLNLEDYFNRMTELPAEYTHPIIQAHLKPNQVHFFHHYVSKEKRMQMLSR